MRPSLALLLASAFVAPAKGAEPPAQPPAAGLLPCDRPVRFAAGWFADPEVDTSKSTADLKKISTGAGAGATPLGHVVVQTKLAVQAQTHCRGYIVRLDYEQPVLRVASEFPPGSCAHARVMNHELTHVRIHRDIARQFRELQYPWAVGERGEAGSAADSAAILRYAKHELARLMRAQDLFDSPEEYARNDSACGGEIARLLKPAGK